MHPEYLAFVCNWDGKKRKWNWTELKTDIDSFGKACMSVGASEWSSVNIIGINSPEWGIAYLGAICANLIATGVYSTNSPEVCLYIAKNSEAEIVVVENRK